MHTPPVRTFLADASLLIDLCNVNRDIINLFARCEGGICVVRDVLTDALLTIKSSNLYIFHNSYLIFIKAVELINHNIY